MARNFSSVLVSKLNLTIFSAKCALLHLSLIVCSVSATKVFLPHKVNTRGTSCILTDSHPLILKRLIKMFHWV